MGRVRFAQPLLFCAATLLMVAGICVPNMRAQDALPTPAPYAPRLGGPQDWSNQHVIYTLNGSVEDMLKLRDDPRFLHSIVLHYTREHRNQTAQPATAELNESGSNQAGWNEAGLNEAGTDQNSLNENLSGANTWGLLPPTPVNPIRFPTIPRRNKNTKVDWAMFLGPNAGLAMGETPAVYTYNYASPSCSNLTATPPVVGDFVVYTINATPGVGTQANLVGLTNLYTDPAGTGFCSGNTGPSFLFSYAIGTGGSPLSPVPSIDGTRVAWIENSTTTTSNLHITIWAANDGGTATSQIKPTGVFSNGACVPAGDSCDEAINYTNATYPGCTTAFPAANGHSDLYVDYASDSGFISANNGLLYHIKNIFSTTTSPTVDFCVPVNTTFEGTGNASSAMSGPLYDGLLNEVFITDSETIYAYNVHASGTTVSFTPASTPSYVYGNTASNYNYQTGPGLMLDAFNGYLYVFSTYDKNSKTSVTQLPTSLASAALVQLGNKSTNTNKILFYGAFDNNYYTNGPANAASTLYSCGTAATATAQDLFAIKFSATTGVANTTPAMSSNTNVNPGGAANGVCSPITEFYDGTNDRIFVGMGEPGATTGANVVTMWDVNTQLTSATATPTATATAYIGGTSGFAADNASTDAQAESIYFSTEDVGTISTPVAVPAATAYNVFGIYTDGSTFPQTGGLDDDGNAYSATELGTSATWNGITYTFGPTNAEDAWQNTIITLPAGQYSTLTFLGNAVNGNLPSQTFIVTYTDGTTSTFTQSVSDWFTPQTYTGETKVVTTTYRNMYNGTKDNRTFILYGYSFAINASKTVKSLTLPGLSTVNNAADNVVVVLGIALSSQGYGAIKLTQSGLQ